jgi:hypothetical protein
MMTISRKNYLVANHRYKIKQWRSREWGGDHFEESEAEASLAGVEM